MSEIIVEIASASNFQEVARFYDEVVQDNSGTQYDVLWRRDLHPSDESIMQALQAKELFIARKDGQACAAAIVNQDFALGYELQPWKVNAHEGESLCIHLFATHPNFQRQGIARQFLREIIQWSKGEGFKALRLDVLDYNAPACKLYESVGFNFVSKTHLAYEDKDVCKLYFLMYEYTL